MVKLILPNSAPPGQGSQKCLENSATELVTSRKTRASDFITSRRREVTKSVALVSGQFWLPWPGGAELDKMSFTIEFVYENYNF